MIQFGVQIEPQFGYDYHQIFDIIQAAEKSDFSHAWFSDHFMMTAESSDLISYECFSAMFAAASKTTTLRLGSMVFCNNYRHPAVLAKQIASLDHFSNGRIDFGYGAGWKEVEYNAYGIEYPSAGVRIKQLSEGIDVIRRLWEDEYADYEGEYYQLKKAVSFPKPVQSPMPVWVGTMEAKPKMLSLAAQKADGINIAWSFSPDVYQEKLERIDNYCKKFDRDPSTLIKSYGVWTRVYSDVDEKLSVMKEVADTRGFTLEQVQERYSGALHGTIDEIIEKINKYINLGITHFIHMFPQGKEVESMKIFQKHIIPKIGIMG